MGPYTQTVQNLHVLNTFFCVAVHVSMYILFEYNILNCALYNLDFIHLLLPLPLLAQKQKNSVNG